MLGLIRPCSLGDVDLVDRWRAHMCGVCLALRDGHGQWARVLLNTDAILASVLLEAQQNTRENTVGAGRCVLRGMRRAQVIPADAVSVRLGASVSMTLASAKAVDEAGESDLGLSGHGRARGSLARRVAPRLRLRAEQDGPVATAIGVASVIDRVGDQAVVESSSRDLHEITAATADACAAVFGATADLAGRPGNRPGLVRIGSAFGRCAHLLDAVADLDTDRARGAYNPLEATGMSREDARRECHRLHGMIAAEVGDLSLTDDDLVRATLVRGLHHAIGRAFGGPVSTARMFGVATLVGSALCAATPDPFAKPADDTEKESCPRSCLSECCSDCCEDCCCGSCCDCCS